MTLVVTHAAGFCTIQDLGRPGHMHEGLPTGGALSRDLLIRANRAAGNADDAAAIEILGRLTIRADHALHVATDAGPRLLRVGQELEIASEPRRVAYLAIRGGIDAPLILGGRGTHTSAGLGAPLRTGARIDAAGAPRLMPAAVPFTDRTTIRVIPGPDHDAFAPGTFTTLCAAPYRILPASDRVGTRLSGAPLPRTTVPERSRPMALGAIEVPRDNQPIVLGPEHPTTGGYPIVAVIASADLGAFHAIRLGGSVRFVTDE